MGFPRLQPAPGLPVYGFQNRSASKRFFKAAFCFWCALWIVPGPVLADDGDGDGIDDSVDNCPTIPNPNQEDLDGDLAGDACDECDDDPNKIAQGVCGCGIPDTGDRDGDTILDCVDNCPSISNPDQANSDQDAAGDACDECPIDPDKILVGICGCGIPDSGDGDTDGVLDCVDNCPLDANFDQSNQDGDSAGDACEDCDEDPLKTNPGLCGCGFPEDATDTDGDGAWDCFDNCPNDANPNQEDGNGDGIGDACPPPPPPPPPPSGGGGGTPNIPADDDLDGISNELDNCPTNANPDQANQDGDALGDRCDRCPNDSAKIAGGACGCGNPDVDSDADSLLDCVDICPSIANIEQTDFDNDRIGNPCDDDRDGDSVANDLDACDNTTPGATADVNGCSEDQNAVATPEPEPTPTPIPQPAPPNTNPVPQPDPNLDNFNSNSSPDPTNDVFAEQIEPAPSCGGCAAGTPLAFLLTAIGLTWMRRPRRNDHVVGIANNNSRRSRSDFSMATFSDPRFS